MVLIMDDLYIYLIYLPISPTFCESLDLDGEPVDPEGAGRDASLGHPRGCQQPGGACTGCPKKRRPIAKIFKFDIFYYFTYGLAWIIF